MGKVHIQLSKKLRDFELDIQIKVDDGIHVIFGPSGCGKTTMMNAIAGMNHLKGHVRVANKIWQDDTKNIFVKTYQRHLGHVMQSPIVFKNMTVGGILQYALDNRFGATETELNSLVEEFKISFLMNEKMNNLSGGEKQKIWIILAFLGRPDMILLDEVTTGLDKESRKLILKFIKKYSQTNSIPIFYITHSIQDTLTLANYVHFMDRGKITGTFSLIESLDYMLDEYSSEEVNILYGKCCEVDKESGISVLEDNEHRLYVKDTYEVGSGYCISFLPDQVTIMKSTVESTALNCLECIVCSIEEGEDVVNIELNLKNSKQKLWAKITPRSYKKLGIRKNEIYYAQFKALSVN